MAKLLVIKGYQEGKEFYLVKDQTIIGRSLNADICFNETYSVSRKHAKITKSESAFYIEDLKSKNGTYVNNKKVERCVLNPEDQIQVGSLTLKLEFSREDFSDLVNVVDARPLARETIIKSADELLKDLTSLDISPKRIGLDQTTPTIPVRADEERQTKRDIHKIERNAYKLKILYDVAQELISIRPLDEFLDLVVNLVFEVAYCERVFLMLVDEKSELLVPTVAKVRKNGQIVNEDPLKIQISRTIADMAKNEIKALLTTDAQTDQRFMSGESIQIMGIRSAMCVPLHVKKKVLGTLYVDTLVQRNIFDTDDLELLNAFGAQAALGIEQARLNEKIKNEIKIRSKLERYHSPEVVSKIIAFQGDEDFEPVVLEATILFADIKNFTPLAERMTPSDVASLLNEYYTVVTEIIFKYGGTLDKFIGDAVMAVFGAPVTLENDPERAVLAAIEMQQSITTINKSAPFNKRYQIRIGINTGKVIAGDFGAEKRMEFTVLGNAVNAASRIEHTIARPGEIAIGEQTYKRISGIVPTRFMGEFNVKGLAKKLMVYQVLFEQS